FSAVAGEQGALAEVADWFAVIYIDAIDEPNRRGKHGLFQDIFSAHGLRPDEVLVVGDNPDSEIEGAASASRLHLPFQKDIGPVELEEFSLRFSKPAHVHNAICDDSHLVHRVRMRNRTHEQFAVVLEGNKSAVEQMINCRREEQAVALEQSFAIVGFAPRFDVACNQMFGPIHACNAAESFEASDFLAK